MIEMRQTCSHCKRYLTGDFEPAYICFNECTFCKHCAESTYRYQCPNCHTNLCPRPSNAVSERPMVSASSFTLFNSGEWLKLSVLALFTVLLLAMPLVVKLRVGNLAVQAINNAGHTVIFAVFSLAFLRCWYFCESKKIFNPMPVAVPIILTVILTLLLGLSIEVSQHFMGRPISLSDLALDLQGNLLGLCIFFAFTIPSSKRRWLILGAVTLLVLGVIKPVNMTYNEYLRYQAMPLLWDFETSRLNVYFLGSNGGTITVGANPNWSGNESNVLTVNYAKGTYPGVTFANLDLDISTYQFLCSDIFNPSNQMMYLGVNIQDNNYTQSQAKYDRAIVVPPGQAEYCIDIQEIKAGNDKVPVELTNINIMVFYAVNPSSSGSFSIDNIRLFNP